MGVKRVNVRVCVFVSYISVFTIFHGLTVITWCSSVLVLVVGSGCDGCWGGKKSISSPQSWRVGCGEGCSGRASARARAHTLSWSRHTAQPRARAEWSCLAHHYANLVLHVYSLRYRFYEGVKTTQRDSNVEFCPAHLRAHIRECKYA